MDESDLRVETQLNIAKPMSEVFEAIVNPEQMAGYFITTGTARLDEGQPVTWTWSDCGAELVVKPVQVESDRMVSFQWNASGQETTVVIEIEEVAPGRCVVNVTESDWSPDEAGITQCLGQMQGWVHMLCCLKAYLEHDIGLRR